MQGGDEMPLEPKQRLCCRCRITYNSRVGRRKSSSKKRGVGGLLPSIKKMRWPCLNAHAKLTVVRTRAMLQTPANYALLQRSFTDAGVKAMQVYRVLIVNFVERCQYSIRGAMKSRRCCRNKRGGSAGEEGAIGTSRGEVGLAG